MGFPKLKMESSWVVTGNPGSREDEPKQDYNPASPKITKIKILRDLLIE